MEDMTAHEIKEDLREVKSKVDKHTQDITRLQESHKFIQNLSEEVVKTNKALNETIQDIKITMISLQSDVSDVKLQVSDIKTDFNRIKDESNFNIMEYIKKNFPTIIIAISFVGYILATKYGIK